MKKIAVCGAGRYKDAIAQWVINLSLQDNIVLSRIRADGVTPEEKLKLDALHLAKIEMVDEIFVVDIDSYVDKFTMNEIQFATQKGKTISYLSQDYPDWKAPKTEEPEPTEMVDPAPEPVDPDDTKPYTLTLPEISDSLHQAAEAIDKLVGR